MSQNESLVAPGNDPLLQHAPTLQGHKVLGRIVVLEQIGAGGMGVVYRGFHLNYGIEVAVKVLLPRLAADREFIAAFCREAQAALMITHQNVVRAYGVEEGHGLHFCVMELVDGESARQRVKRAGRMSLREALVTVTGVAAGLAEAHREGLVHRDIKPANLLIANSGRVKLADLGLVHPAMDAATSSPSGTPFGGIGTPRYLAPECWNGVPPHPTQDVWALGATLYYLLTGKHALPSLPSREMRKFVRDNPLPTLAFKFAEVPALDAIYERCVAADPRARFPNANELHAALLSLGNVDEALLRNSAPSSSRFRVPVPPDALLDRIAADLDRPPPPVHVDPPRRRPRRKSASSSPFLALLAVAATAACVWMYLQKQDTTRVGKKSEAAVTPPQAVPPSRDDASALPGPGPDRASGRIAPVATAKPRPTDPPKSANESPARSAAEPAPPAPVPAPVRRFRPPSLEAWLEQRDVPGAYDELFVPYRASLFAQWRSLTECLQPLDDAMRSFPTCAAGSVNEQAATELIAVLAARRQKGEALRPFLPWLLLLQKNDPADLRIEICLFEAWAGLDPALAREAQQRIRRLLEPAGGEPPERDERLEAFLFEAKAIALGGEVAAAVLRITDGCVTAVDTMLPPFWLGKGLLPDLDRRYELAMQDGAFDEVGAILEAMLQVDPSDPSPLLVQKLKDPTVKVGRLEVEFSKPEKRPAIIQRLRVLGVVTLTGLQPEQAIKEAQHAKAGDPIGAFFDTTARDNLRRLIAVEQRAEARLRPIREEWDYEFSRNETKAAELKPELDRLQKVRDDAQRTREAAEKELGRIEKRRKEFSLGR